MHMSFQQDWEAPEPRKSGMSGGMKLLLILGGVGGFVLLLCCGGVGFIFYKAKNLITTDPDTIRERTQSIATIEILPGFKPALSMDFVAMRWVQYQGDEDENSMLMLMEFGNAMMQGNNPHQREAMLRQMREQQLQQGGHAQQEIEAEETQTREFMIGGRKVPFTFIKGKSEEEGKAVRQVTGSFTTAGGVAMLMLAVPEEKYDEAAVIRMLESIRTPLAPVEAEPEADEAAETKAESDQPAMEAEATPSEGEAAGKAEGEKPEETEAP
jgi:hypothetical protein